MRTRNRTHHEDDGAAAGTPGPAGTGNGQQLRQEAGRLAAETDSILERALAGDSQRFLDANQQRGGQ